MMPPAHIKEGTMKILLTRRIPGPALETLQQHATVDLWDEPRPLPREILLERVQGAGALLCMLTDRIDAEVMDAAPDLRIIANYAVGFDNIDLAAARERNIVVTNTPGVLTDATADLAWALLFAAARNLVPADRLARSGAWQGWDPMQMLGADISGATLGIVGAGRIGTAMALRAQGFGMPVVYCARRDNPVLDERLHARRLPLDELLSCADFVSLHVPLTPETRHLINDQSLGLMKDRAVLINTARGPIIDETALARALREKRIGAAGLDVFENEPAICPDLLDLDNCVLAPHLGSATVGTRTQMADMAAANILAVLDGGEPPNRVV